jgi:hypothetical protein
MKLIVYTLEADGTVPVYVTDGGYWAWENGGTSPQDLDLVGVAIDEAPQEGFADEGALISYGNSKNFAYTDSRTGELISVESMADNLWAKLS